MRLRLLIVGVSCLLVSDFPLNAQRDELRSVAERSGYIETSRYADVRAFLDALAGRSPHVRIETFGTTEDGRALPLAVIGDPPATERPAHRPVVLLLANIHAGEVEGKEALLHIARRLATGDLQPWLRRAVWLLAPIYNADGNEKVSLTNRPEQNGPIGGVGTRENAKGLDLNRDYIKLESAEARSLVAMMTKWDPDVFVDLHTTNGSYHGYHLTYATSLSANTDPHLDAFARDQLLGTVRRAMASRHGFRVFDYGNFAHVDGLEEELEGFAHDDPRPKAWRTFDGRPRFGTNYYGLRNRIAVLSEAYSYLDFKRRIEVTEAFVEEIMRFVSAKGDDIRSRTARADREWTRADANTEAGVAFALQPHAQPLDVLVGAVGSQPNPRSGRAMTTMVENAATPTPMAVFDRFTITARRRVPREYIVHASPAALEAAARTLGVHGIRVETVAQASRRSVDQFVIEQVSHTAKAFQGHQETSVHGRFERREVDIATGALSIRTDQPLGRLVFALLEPESNDSLTTWNVFDADLTEGGSHPVLKVF